jgi:hypothetical protein
MQQGREFDAAYNSQLSDDALPALFEAIPEMSDRNRETVIYRLATRYCSMSEERDLRSVNISRSAAWVLLRSNSAFVDSLGGCEKRAEFRLKHYRDID